MKRFSGYQTLSQKLVSAVLTVGNFDGVHLGHQKIIQKVIERARGLGGPAVVYTFRPHPQIALHPGKGLKLITTYDEKAELLERMGVDVLIEEPFSREFSTHTPQSFFNTILAGKISPAEIVVGYDFGFGKERSGGLETLRAFCQESQVPFEVIPQQFFLGEVASSSKIREHLLAGRVSEASNLLGRRFGYQGRVVKGDQRGRGLGFPTANLHLDEKLALPYGVYATSVSFEGVHYPSVTNIGVRPTFGADHPVMIETHVLDYSGNLYGTQIHVEFIQRIRAEMKFSGKDALIEQIQRDILQAREICAP